MLKYLYHGIVGVVIVLFAGSVYFLYTHFYLTLTNSREVTSLVGKVSVVSLDLKRFENVIDHIRSKESLNIEPVTVDPFYPVISNKE